MRVLRAKQIRKFLKFYKIIFHIEPPYQIILDGNFIYNGMKNKVDLVNRLKKLLQDDEVVVHITRSSLNELTSVGEKTREAVSFANEFCRIIEDGHCAGETAADKLIDVLRSSTSSPTNSKYYFVASQDKDLRSTIGHTIAGIPLIYFNQVTLVLEPPSDLSRRGQVRDERSKTIVSQMEKDLLDQLRDKTKTTMIGEPTPTERKKRKATSPNPLSHRKAREDSQTTKKKKLERFIRGSH